MRIKRLTELPLKSLTLVIRLVSLNIYWYLFVRIYIAYVWPYPPPKVNGSEGMSTQT